MNDAETQSSKLRAAAKRRRLWGDGLTTGWIVALSALLCGCGAPSDRSPSAPSEIAADRFVAPTPKTLDTLVDDLPSAESGPMAGSQVASASDVDPLMSELASERQAQRNLPMAGGPVWDILRTTRIAIDEQSQLYTAAHPPAVRALAGTSVTVRGYMLPLESTDRTAHFLVSPYTPVCFFHPPAEPNEIIEVHLRRPMEAGYNLVEVTGRLQLADNGEKGLFFVIENGAGRIVQRVE